MPLKKFLVSITLGLMSHFIASFVYANDGIITENELVSKPFNELDTLEKNPLDVGQGFPENIQQIGGNLVFSSFDKNGNTRSIFNLDFTTGKKSYFVQGRKDPLLIAVDSKYIVIHTPHSASFPIEVIDRGTGKSVKQIRLHEGIVDAFISGDRLYLVQGMDEKSNQKIAIFDLPNLANFHETTIPGQIIKSSLENRIFTVHYQGEQKIVIVFDHQLNELGRITLPPQSLGTNRNCQPGDLHLDGDHLVLVSNCGEITVANLKTFKIENVISRHSEMYSIAMHKGLIFTTTENKNGVVVFDVSNGHEMARLPIFASSIFINGDILLAAGDPISTGNSGTWPMQTYKLNDESIRSGKYRNQAVIESCTQAEKILEASSDIYQAVKICEQSGINGVVDSGNVPNNLIPIAIKFAGWLGQTLDRFDDSLILFDKLSKLGIQIDPDSRHEPLIKAAVISNNPDVKILQLVENKPFDKAVKIGLQAKPIKLIDLPPLQGDLYFSEKYIYAEKWDCYPTKGGGDLIQIFDRKSLEKTTTLKITECDDEQQDALKSLSIVDDKLIVDSQFRYPDAQRRSQFVFELTTWQPISDAVIPETDISGNAPNKIVKYPVEYVSEEGRFSTKSYDGIRTWITSSSPGITQYVFYKKGNSEQPSAKVAEFSMAGTSSSTAIPIPNRDDLIFMGQPDDLGHISLLYFDPIQNKKITFAVLPKIVNWAVNDYVFCVSNGIGVFIFNVRNLKLIEVIPKVFEDNSKGEINGLYVDDGRLIVRSLYGSAAVFGIQK